MKRGGERTFGAHFDYEQAEQSAARCVVCIHRCLFHDLLAAHDAAELTSLFCALDSVWAEELAHPRRPLRAACHDRPRSARLPLRVHGRQQAASAHLGTHQPRAGAVAAKAAPPAPNASEIHERKKRGRGQPRDHER